MSVEKPLQQQLAPTPEQTANVLRKLAELKLDFRGRFKTLIWETDFPIRDHAAALLEIQSIDGKALAVYMLFICWACHEEDDLCLPEHRIARFAKKLKFDPLDVRAALIALASPDVELLDYNSAAEKWFSRRLFIEAAKFVRNQRNLDMESKLLKYLRVLSEDFREALSETECNGVKPSEGEGRTRNRIRIRSKKEGGSGETNEFFLPIEKFDTPDLIRALNRWLDKLAEQGENVTAHEVGAWVERFSPHAPQRFLRALIHSTGQPGNKYLYDDPSYLKQAEKQAIERSGKLPEYQPPKVDDTPLTEQERIDLDERRKKLFQKGKGKNSEVRP
jgi:hypothetical protein